MGYAHYFKQGKVCPAAAWEKICADFNKVLQVGRMSKVFPRLKSECDEGTPPEVTDAHIRFNGVGDEGHETMYVAHNPDSPGFNFCKTAGKPYDMAVVALLLIMNHHAPGIWRISSDGDASDWAEGKGFADQGLDRVHALPDAMMEDA